MTGNGKPKQPLNVDGTPLESCSKQPVTGFFRTGDCNTGPDDAGLHVVCSRMTQEFLEYTSAQGNDLSTPRPGFPGLKPGDRWCLCAARWLEAHHAGVAPPVVFACTHEAALQVISKDILEQYKA